MIKEQDLREAIAECQGQRNPNASTCIKLASFYTILDHMKEKEEMPSYSFASLPQSEVYTSDTEFGKLIANMDTYHVLSVMDELMTTLSIVNPRLYEGVLRKL